MLNNSFILFFFLLSNYACFKLALKFHVFNVFCICKYPCHALFSFNPILKFTFVHLNFLVSVFLSSVSLLFLHEEFSAFLTACGLQSHISGLAAA